MMLLRSHIEVHSQEVNKEISTLDRFPTVSTYIYVPSPNFVTIDKYLNPLGTAVILRHH